MQEIRLPELVIVFFLFMSVFRPFITGLRFLNGLVWFPLMALGIAVGLFPAYGFRPECIPLLIYMVIMNIFNVPALFSGKGQPWNSNFQDRGMVFTFLTTVFLIITAGIALYFAPVLDTALITNGLRTATIRDEARNAGFFIRIYGQEAAGAGTGRRPLMLLVPPVLGSVTMVDKVCGELRERGFTVMTFSRQGFDAPAVGEQGEKYGIPLGTRIKDWWTMMAGTTWKTANAWGRTLEAERKQDLGYMLSYIRHNSTGESSAFSDTDLNTIFLAGYGAGGTVLALLGGSPELVKQHPAIKGLILVESPFWSVYQGEEPSFREIPENAGWFHATWITITNWFEAVRPKKITGIGPVPPATLPILFLVSHKVTHPQYRNSRYGAILRVLQTAQAPVALAAVADAGFLHYSDYPAKYPLYGSLFAGGKHPIWKSADPSGDTAALMTNFAALLLAATPQHAPQARLLRREGLKERIHIETGGDWNLPDPGYILSP
ncbi:MAG: hypothetical protein LBT14_08635 [Treponema sp.]|jgi:hypothetical protein|nr:hypothetical protein [Treponema sp.]